MILGPAESSPAAPPPFRSNGAHTQGVRQGVGEAHSQRRPEASVPQASTVPWCAGRSLPGGGGVHCASSYLPCPLKGPPLAPRCLASPAPNSWRFAAARGGSPASFWLAAPGRCSQGGGAEPRWQRHTIPPELRAQLCHVLAVCPQCPLLQWGHSGL